MGLRKRLSVPLISSLIRAFMHPSSPFTSQEDTIDSSSEERRSLYDTGHKGTYLNQVQALKQVLCN